MAARSKTCTKLTKYPPKVQASPSQWSMNVVRDKNSLLPELAYTEPGLNLTKEDIIKFKLWPQGIIPYYIDDFSFDKVLRDRIRNYLDVTNRVTGLRFMELPRPPTSEKTRWVLFLNRQGLLNCADHPIKDFTNEGVQKVILGYDCLVYGGELAEAILALVGVPPQHNAPNREEYINIVEDNIIPEKKHLFVALKDDEWLFHDIPYDFISASHYNLHKHSKNGFATIELVEPTNFLVGEGTGFTYNDIWKIRMLYNYIVKNKAISIKASDCAKLFKPGPNFNNYKPLLHDEIQPRNKPNTYTNKNRSKQKPKQPENNSEEQEVDSDNEEKEDKKAKDDEVEQETDSDNEEKEDKNAKDEITENLSQEEDLHKDRNSDKIEELNSKERNQYLSNKKERIMTLTDVTKSKSLLHSIYATKRKRETTAQVNVSV